MSQEARNTTPPTMATITATKTRVEKFFKDFLKIQSAQAAIIEFLLIFRLQRSLLQETIMLKRSMDKSINILSPL